MLATKKTIMKRILLGAALVLSIGIAHAAKRHQPITEHNILSSQLPPALQTDIKKDYKDYWITQLSEEGKGRHPEYFMTLENADQIVKLRSRNSAAWVITNTSVKTE